MIDSAQEIPVKSSPKKGNWALRYLRWLVIGFICWYAVRIFVGQGIYVQTDAMHGTLYAGDYVYVNKLAYGPRVPITPLTIPLTDIRADWIEIPYYRLPGTSEVKINDIIVFNFPGEHALPIDCRHIEVMRCVALPGDSFAIEHGVVTVNGIALADPSQSIYMYSVALNTKENPDSLFNRIGIKGKFSSSDGVHFVIRMNVSQADSLEKSGQAISVVPSVLDADRYDDNIFPQNTSKSYRWNADNFGPVLIPAKGKSIDLSLNNIHLYKTAITEHEGNQLENRNDSIFINGNFAPSYTFKMNYYFVMGDNRYEAHDSRYWGFVPEDHVIGRASW